MPPKKRNGFYEYTFYLKRKMEREGHKFPGGMGDVHRLASENWNKMSPEEKEVYHKKAGRVSGTNTNRRQDVKYDSFGVSIAWKEEEEKKRNEEKVSSLQKVEEKIKYLANHKELESHVFHFAHFNFAVQTTEKEWPPCEVAVVKFSLLNGISGHYHEFIDPAKLRIGYSFTAKQHSEATHRIPRDFKLANSNYAAITNAIKDMLKNDDGGFCPVFYFEKDIPKANYIFNWLIEKSCECDPHYDRSSPFRVYSLDKLLYELRRHADLQNPRLVFPTMVMVADRLQSDTFDYFPSMACQWHDEEDRTKYCSLTAVRRYAYVISDMCCAHYQLKLLPNRHCPSEVMDTNKYKMVSKVEPKATQIAHDDSDEDSDEDSEFYPNVDSNPRLPQTMGTTVGSRLALQFQSGNSSQSVGQGMQGVNPSPTQRSSPAGRGRGRGFLSSF